MPLKLESYLKKLENFVNDSKWEKLNNGDVPMIL